MEPPKRKPSSTLIIREELAAGAVHELRPIQPITERQTARPPPIPYDPKPSPIARPVPRTQTAVGMPAPPSDPPPMRPKLDSQEIRTDILLAEIAAKGQEAREAEAEAAALRRQLRELDHSNHVPRVEVVPASSPPPKRGDWLKALFGLLGAITLFLGGLGTYLGARAAAKENKVDNVAAKQAQQQAVTDPLQEKVTATDRYNRLMAAALSCRLRHVRAALERDGMSLDSLPSGAVDWRSRYLPGRSVRASPEWVMGDDCPEMPAPP